MLNQKSVQKIVKFLNRRQEKKTFKDKKISTEIVTNKIYGSDGCLCQWSLLEWTSSFEGLHLLTINKTKRSQTIDTNSPKEHSNDETYKWEDN